LLQGTGLQPTATTKQAFLRALHAAGNERDAAKEIAFSLLSLRRARQEDGTFAAAWDAILREVDQQAAELAYQAQTEFLQELRRTGSIRLAAEATGIPTPQIRHMLAEDPQFAALYQHALELATDDLEAEARRRAVTGVTRPVFYQGEVCGAIQEYSDTLLTQLLKANRPEKYRERYEVTGKVDHAHQHNIDLTQLDDTELDVLEKLLEKSAPTEQVVH